MSLWDSVVGAAETGYSNIVSGIERALPSAPAPSISTPPIAAPHPGGSKTSGGSFWSKLGSSITSTLSGLETRIGADIGVALNKSKTDTVALFASTPAGQAAQSAYIESILSNPLYVVIIGVVVYLIIRGASK